MRCEISFRALIATKKRIFLVVAKPSATEGLAIETLLSLLRTTLDGPDRDVFAERDDSGEWRMLRSHAVRDRIAARAYGLRARGIRPGDRVAIMCGNRVDWIVTSSAILACGAVTVPIYATQAHDQVAHILADSGAGLLFLERPAMRDALLNSGVTLPPIVYFDGNDEQTLRTLDDTGSAAQRTDADALDAVAASVAPDDLAILIYTSGTTGRPKGVMLTHRNVASNAAAAFGLLDGVVGAGARVLSVLPYAHIYESTNVFGYFLNRYTVYVNRRVETLVDDLRSVQPELMFGVPRMYEKVLVAILTRAKAAGGLRAKLVPWALGVGREYMRAKERSGTVPSTLRLQYLVAHALALKKIRTTLGLDSLKLFCSGSAPLHPDTSLTFLGFDVTISEGYGLSECAPVVTANLPQAVRVGSVGRALADVSLRLAEDGELLVRGPNVMLGYYRDDAATEAVMTDGWFRTGDIATIDAEGYVRITDRKKELFKTSGGKYIAPSRVESEILRSMYVNQVMVFGNGRAHPAALVVPNWANLRTEMGLAPDLQPADLADRADVRAFMRAEVMAQTSDLGSFEQIRSIGIVPRDFTIEDGELSPTQKIKRRVVETRYATLIEAVFAATA